jgi:hypothetical protein
MAIEALFLLISSSGPQTKGSKLVLKVSFRIHFKKIHHKEILREMVNFQKVNLPNMSTRALSVILWLDSLYGGWLHREGA